VPPPATAVEAAAATEAVEVAQAQALPVCNTIAPTPPTSVARQERSSPTGTKLRAWR
jgi:hypothetical protein